MTEIEAEIDSAVGSLGIGTDRWCKLPPVRSREICSAVKDQFVVGNPRSWWLALRHPAESHLHSGGDGRRFVHSYVPATEKRCWFVPETEEEDLPVYDVCVSEVARVLGECRFFEYYMAGKRMDWLVLENEHNEVLVVKTRELAS